LRKTTYGQNRGIGGGRRLIEPDVKRKEGFENIAAGFNYHPPLVNSHSHPVCDYSFITFWLIIGNS